MPEARDIATAALGRIARSVNDSRIFRTVSLSSKIPEQPGLRFDVSLYLYGDILNLCAGEFWGEWFPCSDPDVVSGYVEAVSGLLEGRFRIVEHSRNGQFRKAFLQRPKGFGWQNISRHYHGFSLPWPATEHRILKNLGSHKALQPTFDLSPFATAPGRSPSNPAELGP